MINLKMLILCLSFGPCIFLKIDNLGYAFFAFFLIFFAFRYTKQD
jgi:hypothetical protein